MPSAELPKIDPADYEDVEVDDADNPEWSVADFSRAGSAASSTRVKRAGSGTYGCASLAIFESHNNGTIG